VAEDLSWEAAVAEEAAAAEEVVKADTTKSVLADLISTLPWTCTTKKRSI
jgi:hypothetical protein